jgi:hypothetical protein
VASITTLAIYDESERCTVCQTFHAVNTGGPAAAIAKALHYLDAYHGKDRLLRVQSELRDLGSEWRSEVPPQTSAAPVRVSSL